MHDAHDTMTSDNDARDNDTNNTDNDVNRGSATLSVLALAISLIMVAIPVGVLTSGDPTKGATISAVLAEKYNKDDAAGLLWTRLWVGVPCVFCSLLIITY